MKTQLILLDIPVIVSDEEILNNDLCLYLGRFDANILCKAVDTETGRVYQELNINPIEEYGSTDGGIIPLKSEILKIIAGIEGLPAIDWNRLEEEFGWIDIEKIIAQELGFNEYESDIRVKILNLSKRLKKAQSLNEKRFSLDDMFKCFQVGIDYEKEGSILQPDAHGYIQSLQQPKVFDIKVEMLSDSPYDPRSKTGRFEVGDTDKVVIRNNSIKILKKL